MLSVGITGGIGSGKSTVCRVFAVLGVPVFHADAESKRALQEDAEVREAVIRAFGPLVYPEGTLDRTALAARVFGDPAELAKLNAIAHPAVRKRFTRWRDRCSAPYVLVEAALLVDTGWYTSLDRTILVSAPEDLRIDRVMARDGVPRSAVEARIRNQITEDQRLAAADEVILNDGREPVIPQVLRIHAHLLELANA